jgi:hypothetical protein
MAGAPPQCHYHFLSRTMLAHFEFEVEWKRKKPESKRDVAETQF